MALAIVPTRLYTNAASGNFIHPRGIKIQEVSLTCPAADPSILDRQRLDITRFIQSITIIESIYTQGVQVKILVMDTANLIDRYNLNGQNQVTIILERQADYEGVDVPLVELTLDNYYIADIGNVMKAEGDRFGYFEITAVPPHIFRNEFLSADNLVHNSQPPEDSVAKCLAVVAKSSQVELAPQDGLEAKFRYVSGVDEKPLDVAHRIVTSSTNPINKSPVLFYQRMEDKIVKLRLESLFGMFSRPSVREYASKDQTRTREGKERWNVQNSRLPEDIIWQGRTSALYRAVDGAYGSTSVTVDIAKKIVAENEITAGKDMAKNAFGPGKTKPIVEKFNPTPGDKTVGDFAKSTRRLWYADSEMSTVTSDWLKNKQQRDAIHAFLDQRVFKFTVAGGIDLHAGDCIDIVFPKLSPTDFPSDPMTDQNRYLSGKYLIVTASHFFGSVGETELLCKGAWPDFPISGGA